MTYTGIALAVVALTLVLDLAVLRTRLVLRRAFWTSYAIILVFQLLVNGVLTGRTGRHLRRVRGPRVHRRRTCSGTAGSATRRSRTCCSASRSSRRPSCWWVWLGRHGPVRDRARRR